MEPEEQDKVVEPVESQELVKPLEPEEPWKLLETGTIGTIGTKEQGCRQGGGAEAPPDFNSGYFTAKER